MSVYTSLSTGTAKPVHEESRELEDISVCLEKVSVQETGRRPVCGREQKQEARFESEGVLKGFKLVSPVHPGACFTVPVVCSVELHLSAQTRRSWILAELWTKLRLAQQIESGGHVPGQSRALRQAFLHCLHFFPFQQRSEDKIKD